MRVVELGSLRSFCDQATVLITYYNCNREVDVVTLLLVSLQLFVENAFLHVFYTNAVNTG